MRHGLGVGTHLLALARRPLLLWEAARLAAAFRAHRGVIPSSEYVAWRVHTAYGDDMSIVTEHDLVEFLAWRRRMRRIS